MDRPVSELRSPGSKRSPALGERVRDLAIPWLRIRYHGRDRFCPICRSRLRRFLVFGLTRRSEARCPVCGALERHRFLWVFLQRRTDLFDPRSKRMLHLAPEPLLEARFRRLPQVRYLSADLCDPRAMERIDIMNIPHPDESFDLIFCNHVLEHVADDRRAMGELRRVLRSGGWVAIQVPLRDGPTLEDPSATDPEARERLYGQKDHVRFYGLDIKERLEESGLRVEAVRGSDLLAQEERIRIGVPESAVIFLCAR